MEPAVVGGLGAVVKAFSPSGHTSTEVGLAFQHIHRNTAFGQSGSGGQSGDTRPDHDDMWNLGQCAGVRDPPGCRMGDTSRILHQEFPIIGLSPRKVCTILRCQPGMVSLCTPVKPVATRRRWKSEAPSKVFTLRHRWR